MEAFESFVALTMESEDFVVSEAVKFPVTRQTAKASHVEVQTHGFEVDLVGARGDRLVLATVKSYLGSRGVVADHVIGRASPAANRHFALLNNPVVRDAVVSGAAARYRYRPTQVQLRLYVGRFAAPTSGKHEREIRNWCGAQRAGAGAIAVYGLHDVATVAVRLAESKTYRDNAALVSIKVLQSAGLLAPDPENARTE